MRIDILDCKQAGGVVLKGDVRQTLIDLVQFMMCTVNILSKIKRNDGMLIPNSGGRVSDT